PPLLPYTTLFRSNGPPRRTADPPHAAACVAVAIIGLGLGRLRLPAVGLSMVARLPVQAQCVRKSKLRDHLPDRTGRKKLTRGQAITRVTWAVMVDTDHTDSDTAPNRHVARPVNNHLSHVWLILWLSAREGRVALNGVDSGCVADVDRRPELPRTDALPSGGSCVHDVFSALAEKLLNSFHFGVRRPEDPNPAVGHRHLLGAPPSALPWVPDLVRSPGERRGRVTTPYGRADCPDRHCRTERLALQRSRGRIPGRVPAPHPVANRPEGEVSPSLHLEALALSRWARPCYRTRRTRT